jgi:hypothetical protein
MDWRSWLRRVRRERLDQALRPVFDELLIDALSGIGAFEELVARLGRVPPEECGPRVWLALETGTMARLASLTEDRETRRAFSQVLDLWDDVIRLRWPAGSAFPAQFTERVASLVAADPTGRLSPWRERLRRAGDELAAQPFRFPHAAVVAAERSRVTALLDRRGR